MLVLSRKQDQDIVIGDNIRIRVLKIKGNTIRIGIEAPRDVKVIRGELEFEIDPSEIKPDSSNDHELETEITIVFGNDSTTRDSQPEVIPFQRSKSRPPEPPRHTVANADRQDASTNNDSAAYSSISFRAPLPATLQHNRLKEIINDMTRKV